MRAGNKAIQVAVAKITRRARGARWVLGDAGQVELDPIAAKMTAAGSRVGCCRRVAGEPAAAFNEAFHETASQRLTCRARFRTVQAVC